jgi:RNA polymerase sigma-70 factor (ECF subfamily)
MLTDRRSPALNEMMRTVTLPPFELLYDDTQGDVLRLLRRRLGSARAADAFPETFLRALRAYGRLEHGDNLRAWVLTIAANVAIDTDRRDGRTEATEHVDVAVDDELSPISSLEDMTRELPRTERAAVVLRYGYDLTYDQIAAALDSTPAAARQAASTGVRKLRRRVET